MTNLPERDPAKRNSEQGVYRKFEVRRTDGSDFSAGKHDGCEYFVLDINHDPHAIPALTAYAHSCEKTHPALAADLRDRHSLYEPPPARTEQAEGLAKQLEQLCHDWTIAHLCAAYMRQLALEVESLRLRLMTASRGEQEAARAEQLYRETEALLTDPERAHLADARRYRWLRAAWIADPDAGEDTAWAPIMHSYDEAGMDADIDAAIDAAASPVVTA